jgi:lactoylglutathione lyase
LELTFNHDGSTYELGTGYGHIALAVDDLDGTLERLKERGSSPTASAMAARGSASSEIPIVSFEG